VNKKIAIMQPYFFPYIGYFQLMKAVDEFIIYDNIQFSKSSWINRNRILINGKDILITIPLQKDSDFLDIRERYLADNWVVVRVKMLNKIREAYRKAPFFGQVFPLIQKCIEFDEKNLFKFILNSIRQVAGYYEIESKIIISSSIAHNERLRSENRIISICKSRNADAYINPIGGLQLYTKDFFETAGILLYFLRTSEIRYRQFQNRFVPLLSIIDTMMFNSREQINEYLTSCYTLI